MEKDEAIAGVAGAGIGVAAVFLLREYVDRGRPAPVVAGLRGFGEVSSLVGLITGIPALGVGVYGVTTRAFLSRPLLAGLLTYGSAALIAGVISGLRPVREAAGVGVGLPIQPAIRLVEAAPAVVRAPMVIPEAFGVPEPYRLF